MSAPPPPPPPGLGGMSLYANLLDPKSDDSSSASISRNPVVFKRAGEGTDTKKPLDASALRFQPTIRRPQVSKPKPKSTFPKAGAPSASPSAPPTTSSTTAPSTIGPAPPRSTLADWAAPTDDDYLYPTADTKRQRGGRKQKKKNNQRKEEYRAETDWDELYDPARPTNVDEYLRSDERIREIREWKDVLYAHRMKRGRRGSESGTGSDEEMEGTEGGSRIVPPAFAPPASYGVPPPGIGGAEVPPPPPGQPQPDEATGDDAYARRMAMSSAAVPPPPPPPKEPSPPPPLPPPEPDAATISRAPVRYEPAAQPPSNEDMDMDIDSDEDKPSGGLGFSSPTDPADPNAPTPRANRPGQANFATRLMSKYGWSSGQGLGADESGIVAPLRVQVEKRKKKSDAEGGGWAEPSARAKILGGTTRKKKNGEEEEDEGKGKMSPVVVLRGMLEGIEDLRSEVEGGLGQEIGEECGEKYGRLERVFIDIERKQVFIKFTDQVSALRAVNALDGRIFNGNAILPKFFDDEKFEQGVYE